MLHALFKSFVLPILFMASVGVAQVQGQGANIPGIAKAVHWSDAATATDVYLVEGGSRGYRLLVVSNREVKVIYHTSINSVEPVMKELAPAQTVGEVVRYYEFEHTFSRMTIWMALEFKIDGKDAPNLTRAFYNDIFTLVPANQFFGVPKKR